jgi:hypothetical protein
MGKLKDFENGQMEKSYKKFEAKYIAKHGRIKFLAKVTQLPKQYQTSSILFFIVAGIWLISGILGVFGGTNLYFMNFALMGSFAGLGIAFYAMIPFYKKKADDALAELRKNLEPDNNENSETEQAE